MPKKDTSSRYAMPAWAGVFLVIGIAGLGWANLMVMPLLDKGRPRVSSVPRTRPIAEPRDVGAPSLDVASVPLPQALSTKPEPVQHPGTASDSEDLLSAIPFRNGSYALEEAAMPRLLLLAECLKTSPSERLTVTGCAIQGRNHKRSLFLAKQRARAVRDRLVALGVGRKRLTIATRLVPRDAEAGDGAANQVEFKLRIPEGVH